MQCSSYSTLFGILFVPSTQMCWKLGTQGGGTERSCGTCWRWGLIRSSCVSLECCPWKGCRAFSRKCFVFLNRAAITLILAHPAFRLPFQDVSPPIHVYLTSANGHGALTRAQIVLFHYFIFSFQNCNLMI